jgi:hypothetical protein
MDTSRRGPRIAAGLVAATFLMLAVQALRNGWSTKPPESAPSPDAETGDVAVEGIATRRRLDAAEVERQLAGILSAISDPQTRAVQVRRIIESADFSDPSVGARIWDFVIRNLPVEESTLEALQLMGSQWVVADRAAALGFLVDPERIPPGFDRSIEIQNLFALRGVLIEWTEWDRGEALHLARTLPSAFLREGLLTELYRQWARSDPETAWLEVLKEDFAEEAQRLRTEVSLIPVISRKDPNLALRLARSLPTAFWETPESYSATAGLHEWARENPAWAALYIEGMPGFTGEGMRSSLVGVWSEKDPAAALDWALRQGNLEGPTQEAFEALARRDVANALDRYSGVPATLRRYWAPVLALQWASSDPASASAWALRQREAGLGSNALLQSLPVWAQADPSAAAEFIRGILPQVTDSSEQLALARAWVVAEPGLSLDQLRSLVVPENHDALFADVVKNGIASDPNAARAALERIVDPGTRRTATSGLGVHWGQQNPLQAMEWAQTLPSRVDQESAIRSVFEGWATRQPEAAAAHVPNLEAAQRDQALVGLVQAVMNQAPADAANRSLQVSDPAIQAQLLESTFQRWGRSHPEAASVWLDQARLPAELVGRLRSRIR